MTKDSHCGLGWCQILPFPCVPRNDWFERRTRYALSNARISSTTSPLLPSVTQTRQSGHYSEAETCESALHADHTTNYVIQAALLLNPLALSCPILSSARRYTSSRSPSALRPLLCLLSLTGRARDDCVLQRADHDLISSYQASNNFTDSSGGSISTSPSSAASSLYTNYPHNHCTSVSGYHAQVQLPQAFVPALPTPYASTRIPT